MKTADLVIEIQKYANLMVSISLDKEALDLKIKQLAP